jgi:hypothetical protein
MNFFGLAYSQIDMRLPTPFPGRSMATIAVAHRRLTRSAAAAAKGSSATAPA